MTLERSYAAPVALAIVTGCALAELGMREWFHRVSDRPFHMAFAAMLIFVLVATQLAMQACRPFRERLSRLPFVVAISVYAWLVLDSTNGTGNHEGMLALLEQQTWLLAALLGIAGLLFLSTHRWRLARRAVVVAAVAFIAAQPMLVAFRAPRLIWPPLPAPLAARAAKPTNMVPDLTVLVLLDELNSNRASGIADALRDEHYTVSARAIASVGDGTAKVIPAMFGRRDFSKAKSCSLSATCSDGNVLDFARITASRPDIDIVGFFHPYCDIRGLRWCRQAAVPLDLFHLDRWECAQWRRTGLPKSLSAPQCDAVFRRGWNSMVDAELRTIWDAPAWTHGGLLFLHVPLPHPPGRLSRASLKDNYLDAIQRAVVLVRAIGKRAEEVAGRRVTLVIFSDHPLRQSEWCTGQWVFSSMGCKPDPGLEDRLVPLIVAGTGDLPRTDDISNNGQIFDIADR